jgi:hypothetical protein
LSHGPFFFLVHPNEVRPTEVIAVFDAITGINELLRKNLDDVVLVATFQAAQEVQIENLGVIVLENHIFDVNAFEFLFVFRPLLDITMQFAILGNGMAPKLFSAARFLANFELYAFFLFVFGQLHCRFLWANGLTARCGRQSGFSPWDSIVVSQILVS